MGPTSTSTTPPSGRPCRIALLYPGDREARRRAAPEESRFLPLFKALAELGAHAEPAVYHDDFADDVRRQLAYVDGVLCWMNPIQDGHNRSMLNAMLREVAAAGVFVSADPDVIEKLGTKEVLYTTRDIGWGSDTALYRSAAQMRRELPARLAAGARVLKRLRGHSGSGVWRAELHGKSETMLRVRHAQRGSVEERITFEDFCRRCEEYFANDGGVLDQAWQSRLPEGMVRCYLVHGIVEGLGLQAINALYPAPPGAPPESAPPPGPRLYHPPTLPGYQSLKWQVEEEWVPAMQRLLGVENDRLPVLWDCDFLLGPKSASGADTYVLCEINASSVSPFPESAVVPVARAVLARVQKRLVQPLR
ncbi:MAG TPA: Cj0069 family protein [Burkholderiales bacterium]|nr:Cj0069 family protein [Burkholderiales bacterium]